MAVVVGLAGAGGLAWLLLRRLRSSSSSSSAPPPPGPGVCDAVSALGMGAASTGNPYAVGGGVGAALLCPLAGPVIGALGDAAEWVGGALGDAGEAVGGALGDAGEAVGKATATAVTATGEAIGTAATAATGAVVTAITATGEAVGKTTVKVVTTTGAAVGTAASSTAKAVATATTSTVKAVGTAASSTAKAVATAVKAVTKAPAKAVKAASCAIGFSDCSPPLTIPAWRQRAFDTECRARKAVKRTCQTRAQWDAAHKPTNAAPLKQPGDLGNDYKFVMTAELQRAYMDSGSYTAGGGG